MCTQGELRHFPRWPRRGSWCQHGWTCSLQLQTLSEVRTSGQPHEICPCACDAVCACEGPCIKAWACLTVFARVFVYVCLRGCCVHLWTLAYVNMCFVFAMCAHAREKVCLQKFDLRVCGRSEKKMILWNSFDETQKAWKLGRKGTEWNEDGQSASLQVQVFR